jgi:aspartate/methionine/tyrosine aminotransferase
MKKLPLVANRMEQIPFAGIRKVFQKASALEAKGQKVIHFEIGRPDFDTPLHIKEAAKTALDNGLVHYTQNNGLPGLRQALGERLQADKNLRFDPETEIMVTAGGQEALYLTFMSILNPGDEVIIPGPCFGPFAFVVSLAGGVPVSIPLQADANYCYDLAAAQQAVTERTRAILVNSPHNPTGGVLSPQQVKEVAKFALENDLLLICDEAYDRLIFAGEYLSPASLEGMRERTILCGSLSKAYAMTGWRIGYIAGPEAVISATHILQQNVLLAVTSFAQYGAIAALNGPQDCVEEMRTEFDRRRKMLIAAIDGIPELELEGVPTGAFYVFPRILLPRVTSAEVADYLLDEAGVAVVDGKEFGAAGDGYIRISYATSYEDCCEGIKRIAKALTVLGQRSN